MAGEAQIGQRQAGAPGEIVPGRGIPHAGAGDELRVAEGVEYAVPDDDGRAVGDLLRRAELVGVDEIEDGRGAALVDYGHRHIVEPDVLLLHYAAAVGLGEEMAEPVEHELGGNIRSDCLLHPLLEGVVEIGAHGACVQRGAGVAAIVVGGEGISVRRVSRIRRYLPAGLIGEGAHVAAGGDRGDAVGGRRIGIAVRGAADHPRQAVAHPVIGVALRAIGAAGRGEAVQVVIGRGLRPAGDEIVGDRGDVARRVIAVGQVLNRHASGAAELIPVS